ncbi:hypothetical protein [Streptomyces sp. NRRL F-4474]|uniref:hypothetical protein n=1 Tax=Streptomyces sp. NRRL F-4474 TaxID=1463851 RepID=UPI001F48BE68|nr:hypothetical protein [Streptomyces sp. NRRL F-4474]
MSSPRIVSSDDGVHPLVSPVGSHNEWDPLEEVVVGRLEGATFPSRHPIVTCNVPMWAGRLQGLAAGFRYPRAIVEPAQRELDEFIALLRSLGVTVRRPDPVDHRRRHATPDWPSRGFANSCPRDSLLVIGDEIIETPMAWPCRYTRMLRALEGWGFEPVPCDLLHYAPFGGSFHCATLDIRRRGALETYFPRPAAATASHTARHVRGTQTGGSNVWG